MPDDKVQFNVRLSGSGAGWLKELARDNHVSTAAVVRVALAMAREKQDDMNKRLKLLGGI